MVSLGDRVGWCGRLTYLFRSRKSTHSRSLPLGFLTTVIGCTQSVGVSTLERTPLATRLSSRSLTSSRIAKGIGRGFACLTGMASGVSSIFTGGPSMAGSGLSSSSKTSAYSSSNLFWMALGSSGFPASLVAIEVETVWLISLMIPSLTLVR